MDPSPNTPYRGRLAPSPTGYLHLGHASTFWKAQQRVEQHAGTLVLRNEDLDPYRCRPEFVEAFMEDLSWFGLRWTEGPDCGGPFAPYDQSARRSFYVKALETLGRQGFLYPCTCSRKDVRQALSAPQGADEEPIYPGTCRPTHPPDHEMINQWMNGEEWPWPPSERQPFPRRVNWRFRVPSGRAVVFDDLGMGSTTFEADRDFGDFVVWRHDDVPSYQLAVVVDDHAMNITEVVRGADLLTSTARQILLYQALDLSIPNFYHCPLVKDEGGQRLAKRHDALSLRHLKEAGKAPEELRSKFLP